MFYDLKLEIKTYFLIYKMDIKIFLYTGNWGMKLYGKTGDAV